MIFCRNSFFSAIRWQNWFLKIRNISVIFFIIECPNWWQIFYFWKIWNMIDHLWICQTVNQYWEKNSEICLSVVKKNHEFQQSFTLKRTFKICQSCKMITKFARHSWELTLIFKCKIFRKMVNVFWMGAFHPQYFFGQICKILCVNPAVPQWNQSLVILCWQYCVLDNSN